MSNKEGGDGGFEPMVDAEPVFDFAHDVAEHVHEHEEHESEHADGHESHEHEEHEGHGGD